MHVYDVVALGEILIDFTPAGKGENGHNQFEQNPGGAPANVLTSLSKLGRRTSFIGKVGDDQFGYFLKDILEDNDIDSNGLVFSKDTNTTLAFVHLDKEGDRSFSFYRKPGADIMLQKEEISFHTLEQTRLFHFGSLSLTNEPAATATLEALAFARKQDVLISYDPNLRKLLWEDLDYAKKMMQEGLKYADIVKLSEEELEFLTGESDLTVGTKALEEAFNTKLIFVTLGKEGCFYRRGSLTGQVTGFSVKALDTTGAGDAFLGGALHQFMQSNRSIQQLEKQDLESISYYANAVGALVTTKYGGIPAMPTEQEVREFMKDFKEEK